MVDGSVVPLLWLNANVAPFPSAAVSVDDGDWGSCKAGEAVMGVDVILWRSVHK